MRVNSKRALLLALIDAIAAAHVAAVKPPVESEVDPARRLEYFFHSSFAFVEQLFRRTGRLKPSLRAKTPDSSIL